VIAKAQVIDTSEIKSEKIVFGATVQLTEAVSGASKTYKIVGEFESNKDEGRISFTSPLGKALIGKEEGDTVIVKAPKGDIEYEIESIEYR